MKLQINTGRCVVVRMYTGRCVEVRMYTGRCVEGCILEDV